MLNSASNVLPAKVIANTESVYSIIIPTITTKPIRNSIGIISYNSLMSIKNEPISSSAPPMTAPTRGGAIYAIRPEK